MTRAPLALCIIISACALLSACAAADEADPNARTDTRNSTSRDTSPDADPDADTDPSTAGGDDASTSGTSGTAGGDDVNTSGTSGTSGTSSGSDATTSGTSGSSSGDTSGADTTPPQCVGDETEDLPCGLCGTQTNRCVNGAWVQGVCQQPPEAVCAPAQVQQAPCGAEAGVCTLGTQAMRCNDQCVWEEAGACTGVQPTDEVCDFLDNDCDGFIDNDPDCFATVYEYLDGGFHAYTLFGGAHTPRFRLYAPTLPSAPHPTKTEALWAVSRSGETRLVLASSLTSYATWEKRLLGYCIPSVSDVPRPSDPPPPALFTTFPKSLRLYWLRISGSGFTGIYDNLYRLCVAIGGLSCADSDVSIPPYDKSSSSHAPPSPCLVFDP